MRGWIKMRPQDKWNAGSCDELRVNFGSRGDYPGYPLKRRFWEISSSALSRTRRPDSIEYLGFRHVDKTVLPFQNNQT